MRRLLRVAPSWTNLGVATILRSSSPAFLGIALVAAETQAPLTRFAASTPRFPAFVTPIFGFGPYYVQVLNGENLVEGLMRFEQNQLPEASYFEASASDRERFATPARPLYAFSFDERDTVVGTHSEVASVLSKRMPEIRVHPKLSKVVSRFITNRTFR